MRITSYKGESRTKLLISNDNRVIDWDFTVAVPLQKTATWPKLLQYTPGGVPYGHSGEIMSHPADQSYFLKILREKELNRRGTDIIATLMESSYERVFFEMSLHMKTVHREWIKMHPLKSQHYIDALGQLDQLCSIDPLLQNNQSVSETKEELLKRILI